jgi:hypothetical protein
VIVEPVFLDEPGKWIMVRAREEEQSQPYPFVLGGEAFIPDTEASIRAGEARRFAVFVYNAAPEELEWTVTPEARLLSRSDTAESSSFLFSLDRVPEGTNALTFAVRKKGSSQERRASIPLRVE